MDYPRRYRDRSSKGQGQLVELAPIIVITFLVILLPCIDLLSLFVTYGAGQILNRDQCREAALTQPDPLPADAAAYKLKITPRLVSVTHTWATNGFGHWVNLIGGEAGIVTTITPVSSPTPPAPPASPFTDVRIDTVFSVNPFIPIPVIPGVQGLSAPARISFSSERSIE